MIDVLACVDVFYEDSRARAACVVFENWHSGTAAYTLVRQFSNVAEYESGNFFRRELPCLVGILDQLQEPPDAVLIDGYVWLDPDGRPGLGAHLFDALRRTTPVIGVAKSAFRGAPAVEVLRGQSKTPLYVTAAGVDVDRAAENIRSMNGAHRIPTLLRLADQLSRNTGALAVRH